MVAICQSRVVIAVWGLWCLAPMGLAQATESYSDVEIYWALLHDAAVAREVNLSTAQQRDLRELLDPLDLKFFRLRNKSRDEAQQGLVSLTAELRPQIKKVLNSNQHKRLNELTLWRTGMTAILREDVVKHLKLTESQQNRIRTVMEKTAQAVGKLEQELKQGADRSDLETKFKEAKTDEQKLILQNLSPTQQTAWTKLIGAPFDASQLGNTLFKAPELIDSGEWIGTKPLTLQQTRGQVTIIHFYACGCINCIHNYPWYQEWADRYRGKPVQILGIHTPETESERNLNHVRSKAQAEKFAFPVLLDVNSDNWNAWGNSMWPSVYIVDQRGYLRAFWPGELKWMGNDGEKVIRDRIDQLLQDSTDTAKQPVAVKRK